LPPNSIDVTVLDAMFILHLQSNLPETFGGVARYLLKYIVGNAGNEVHFVTDKWITPSIKDCERDKRGPAHFLIKSMVPIKSDLPTGFKH